MPSSYWAWVPTTSRRSQQQVQRAGGAVGAEALGEHVGQDADDVVAVLLVVAVHAGLELGRRPGSAGCR